MRPEPNARHATLPAAVAKGILLLCAALSLAVVPAFAQNLVQNPGFETGNTTGWFRFGTPTISAQTVEKHSGSYAALVANRSATWMGIAQSFLGALSPGQNYSVSAWVRLASGTNQTVQITVKKVDASGTNFMAAASGTVTSTGWTQFSGLYTYNPVGPVTELTCYVEVPTSADVSYYIDDVVLQPTVPTVPTILTTAIGHGADTYLSNDTQTNAGVAQGPDVAHGTEGRFRHRRFDGTRLKLLYVRFDKGTSLVHFAGSTISVNLTLATRARQMNVYGLINGDPGENWNEATTTFNNAPGILNPGNALVTLNSNLTFLGTMSWPAATGVATSDPSSLNLEPFLRADTDGRVTFLFVNAASDPDNSYEGSVKENAALGPPPTLNMPNAVTCVSPALTCQPVNATAPEGDSAQFVVTATGTDVLTYQWRKNGNPISSAISNSLTLVDVGAADVGSYDVVVANECGSIVSAAATFSLLNADTNTAILQTGGFVPLQSHTRPLRFAAVPGTFSISFSFGFATEEYPLDGDILDSMLLYLQNTNSGLTAVLFMADASGYGWLPFSSSLFPLFDNGLDLSAANPPDLPVVPLNSVSLQATFRVPRALATGWTDLTMMLYDSPNGLNSASWLGPVTIIPPPGELQVLRTDIFRSFGPSQGLFAPTNATYTLTNSGGSKLHWRAIPSASWLTVTPASGDLNWGRTTNVTLTVNSRARSLPRGFYTNQVSFFNDSLPTNTLIRQVEVIVVTPPKLEVLPAAIAGEFRLRLESMPFASFRIEAASNLTSWTAVHTNTTDADGAIVYGETMMPSRRFYRAVFVYP